MKKKKNLYKLIIKLLKELNKILDKINDKENYDFNKPKALKHCRELFFNQEIKPLMIVYQATKNITILNN